MSDIFSPEDDTEGEWVRIPSDRQLSFEFATEGDFVREYFYDARTGACGVRQYLPKHSAAVQARDVIEREMGSLMKHYSSKATRG